MLVALIIIFIHIYNLYVFYYYGTAFYQLQIEECSAYAMEGTLMYNEYNTYFQISFFYYNIHALCIHI